MLTVVQFKKRNFNIHPYYFIEYCGQSHVPLCPSYPKTTQKGQDQGTSPFLLQGGANAHPWLRQRGGGAFSNQGGEGVLFFQMIKFFRIYILKSSHPYL